MNELLALLSSIAFLSDELQIQLEKTIIQAHFPKRSYLNKPGKNSDKVYFIVTGLVRCFTIGNKYNSDEDQEINKWFLLEKDIISFNQSYQYKLAGVEFMQALEPTDVLVMSFSDLEAISSKFPELYQHRHAIAIKYAQLWYNIQDMLRLPTGKERFTYLMKNMPELHARVPQKYLASFIRLNEATLSRIKLK